MLQIDHVVYAVEDFDVATKQFWSEYGLASVRGGRHTGHGTGNWIVPLGKTYVEIMGVLDKDEAASSPMGSWLQRRIEGGGGLVALCLATDDIVSISSRLGLDAVSMSRANHDGSTVRWRVVALEAALNEPPLPFFIQWDIPPKLHPGSLAASHRIKPRGISWVELSTDPQRLESWIGDDSLNIQVVEKEKPQIVAVGIDTEEGELVLH